MDFKIQVIDPQVSVMEEAEALAARQEALDNNKEVHGWLWSRIFMCCRRLGRAHLLCLCVVHETMLTKRLVRDACTARATLWWGVGRRRCSCAAHVARLGV